MYYKLVAKVNAIDTSRFVLKTNTAEKKMISSRLTHVFLINSEEISYG